ncbi:hypothetical protein Tco_1274728 [Tanacetum coccineum]
MDVKSAFLYVKIEEGVYVCQPPGFEDPDFLEKVDKGEKALMDCIKLLELDDSMDEHHILLRTAIKQEVRWDFISQDKSW